MNKKLIGALLICSTTVMANTGSIDIIVDDELACEHNIRLPQGYTFNEFSADCHYNQGLTPVRYEDEHEDKFGFANSRGEIIIKPRFEMAYGFDEDVALVKENGKYGYINAKGDYVIKPQFTDAWSFWEGRAKVIINGKVGFIDKTGKVVIAPIYKDTGDWFENGLISAQKTDKWGFIDKTGKTQIAFKYDSVRDFSEGLAVVGKATKEVDSFGNQVFYYGYIDTKGKMVIPQEYTAASPFLDGTAIVIKDNHYFLIDYQGNVLETEEDDTDSLSD